MGEYVIAVYTPKAGKHDELLSVMRDHVPELRALGYVTHNPWTKLRASDGTMLEIFEWASTEAVHKAHQDPKVHALWGRFAACSDITTLAKCPWSATEFPHFTPVE